MSTLKRSKRNRLKEVAQKPCCFCKRLMLRPGSEEAENNPGLTCSEEHYVPKCRGGSNDAHNIKYSCYRCNQLKGALLPEIFEPFARIILTQYANVPMPLLRDALKQYIYSLAEIAVRNTTATKKAVLVTKLQIGEQIKGRGIDV